MNTDPSETEFVQKPKRRAFFTNHSPDRIPTTREYDDRQEMPRRRDPKPKSEYICQYQLRLNEFIQINDSEYEDIVVRIRRVSSGWLYEYYGVKEEMFLSVAFVPYSDEIPEKQNDVKASFMYRLDLNQKTPMSPRIAGVPDEIGVRIYVRRVPGGWIYEYYNETDMIIDTTVFVPMSGHRFDY